MKKLNKKGFTIVELVIVIAVIAVLAAVLIPTFSGVVSRANESAAMQQAEIAYKNLLATYAGIGSSIDGLAKNTSEWNFYIHVEDTEYYFEVEGGQFLSTTIKGKPTTNLPIYTVKDGEEELATSDGKLKNEQTTATPENDENNQQD